MNSRVPEIPRILLSNVFSPTIMGYCSLVYLWFFGRICDLRGKNAFRPHEAISAEVIFELFLSLALDQSKQLAKLVARRAIQTTDTQRTHLPLDKNKRLLVVVLRPHQTHLDPAVLPLGAFVKNLFSQCQYVELPPSSTTVDYDRIQQQGLETEQVVIAMVVKPAAWHRFGLLPEQDNFVRDLISRRDYILVSLGSPVALESYSAASERIGTFSDVYGSQEALAEYLCGNSSHLKA